MPFQLTLHVLEQARHSDAKSRLLNDRREMHTHVADDGIFHKTKLLNLGLQASTSDWIVPYDVDLIPFRNSFQSHCAAAVQNQTLLLSGYRLLSPDENWSPSSPNLADNLQMAPEDSLSALRKQLCIGERHGVLPIFNTERLRSIHGWNEQFIGWGAEDQDVIERYCKTGVTFARSPDFVYVHLYHPPQSHWNESHLIQLNRDIYRRTRPDI
jgi:hypothetical protein